MSAQAGAPERVLVALDGSRHSLAALEAAVELARRRPAIVTAVFVEDERWSKIALLPAARVVGVRVQAAPDPHAMAQNQRALFRELAERARRIAGPAPVELAARRGDPTRELLSAGQTASVVLMGRAGRLPARDVGTTARRVALGLALPVVLMREGQRLGAPVLLLEDTPDADRAILAAAVLATRDGGHATVVAIDRDPLVRAALVERARVALLPLGLEVRVEQAEHVAAALGAWTRRRGEPVVLTPGGSVDGELQLGELAARWDGPIVVG